jgi:alpha-glucosidase (family GH31 glycosyl hydrolase)
MIGRLVAVVVACLGLMPSRAAGFRCQEQGETILVTTACYQVVVMKEGFRFGFYRPDGSVMAPPHARAGLVFDGADAARTRIIATNADALQFEVLNRAGARAQVTLAMAEHHARLGVKTGKPGAILARTGGVLPAFGLGDHGGRGTNSTDLAGYVNENLRGDGGVGGRLVANFVVFPQADLAEVNVEPTVKMVRLTAEENAQGSKQVEEMRDLYYFFGEPKTIYQDYLAVRTALGYSSARPKYEWFGVGWEAFGALAYNTRQQTVTENLDRYLGMGYPFRWMVLGSGFWPHSDPSLEGTTSFGLWDSQLYPTPRELIAKYHERGLKFILGLRIAFITNGPYAAEGVRGGYFLTEHGRPRPFRVGFPHRPVYLLDAQRPGAVEWYLGLCRKWLDYGVDGFKEDLFGYEKYVLRDDKLNAVNAGLMRQGVYVMGRNGYLSSPMDLHRFEDFNFDQNQDRGPLNGLAFAYSGFPNVYPDIVGGKFVPEIVPQLKESNGLSDSVLKLYYMRNAQYASVNPAMSFGFGPWNFKDARLELVALNAARLHARLQAYIYSAAVDAATTGFPYPLTPLPLAYPRDTNVFQLENSRRRGYEWLLGPSLLAAPLYGNDYPTANTRDVYLPAGRWLDFDTGKVYAGPATLAGFELPPGKTPLFVGGPGVLVLRELETESLTAKIYPVAVTNSVYVFTDRDGVTRSSITNPALPWGAAELVVKDLTAKQTVPSQAEPKTGAVTFHLTPGHDYALVKP